MQRRGPVRSGGEDGAAHQGGPVVGQQHHETGCPIRLGQGHALGFRQRRATVGLLASGQEGAEIRQLTGVELAEDQHIHAGTLTRYRGGVGRPRTPKGRAHVVAARLAEEYPGTARDLCALRHDTPFQLLAATILSAQCTDVRVNLVTPVLFAAYPDADALATADPEKVEEIIRSTGFFRAKARSLIGMASALVERYGGEVPHDLEDLVTVPGVGRKTGNVVRSVDFDLPGLPVDTHVLRLSKRLGLTEESDPVRVEHALNGMIPAPERGVFSLRMILHGRSTCTARRPACHRCVLADVCPRVGIG